MTKDEIMNRLRELEIDFNPADKKAVLQALLPEDDQGSDAGLVMVECAWGNVHTSNKKLMKGDVDTVSEEEADHLASLGAVKVVSAAQ